MRAASADCVSVPTACLPFILTVNLRGSGKYPDYPYYRVIDEIDLAPQAVLGKNRLAIVVFYIGEDFSTYYTGRRGFSLNWKGTRVYLPRAARRPCAAYRPTMCQHFRKKITMQLCFSYRYDAEKADN